MSPKFKLTCGFYLGIFVLYILGLWIEAPEAILPMIALPFVLYFGYRLLKAIAKRIDWLVGTLFFREQRKQEEEERLCAEKERFEKLEKERKEAERQAQERAYERSLLTAPDEISGLFTFRYKKIDGHFGVEIVSFNGFDERDITIPACINNHPVIRIGEKAFTNVAIDTVLCPDSIIEIGEKAFFQCKALKKVKLPASLKRIGEYAFAYCERLEDAVLPEGLLEMGLCAFDHSGIMRISFPSTLEVIPYACCNECGNLMRVDLEAGIKRISGKAFYHSDRLETIKCIVIPESVSIIEHDAFKWRRTSIAFLGMQTTGEGKSYESIGGGTYYVLPGSAIQRYAREHQNEVKPLSGFNWTATEEERKEWTERQNGQANENCDRE